LTHRPFLNIYCCGDENIGMGSEGYVREESTKWAGHVNEKCLSTSESEDINEIDQLVKPG
jgi:hypothetical protein